MTEHDPEPAERPEAAEGTERPGGAEGTERSEGAEGLEPEWAGVLRGLVGRVLGAAAVPKVTVAGLAASGQVERPVSGSYAWNRSYAFEARDGRLRLEATDAVSAAVGLHAYLQCAGHRAVHWDTELPLDIGGLPDAERRHEVARVREATYLNFCTASYTTAYWDWSDWEREIDWMALHGVTMPLAVTGHEGVLRLAYSRLGLTDDAGLRFLGGPGYLPFLFMGCLDSYAGPMPASWVEEHVDLGRRILERERAYGMTPVLPAFTGHVPRELATESPGDSDGADGRPRQGARSRDWQGFTTWMLAPDDPRFADVGAEITRAQLELFGTDHLYASDPFIEMVPVDADPAYPGRIADAVLAGLTRVDPEAVWVMQAWPFSFQREFWTDERVREFLDAVPDERMILLDLWAEHDPLWKRFDGFGGKRWLWCGLLDFGGRTEPGADLAGVPAGIDAALAGDHPPIGLGLTMESTRTNAVFYELLLDQGWQRATPDELAGWVDGFVERRYGVGPREVGAGELRTAWRGLLETIYAADPVRLTTTLRGSVLPTRPAYRDERLDVAATRELAEARAGFRTDRLAEAWGRLIAGARGLEGTGARLPEPLGHDLLEVGTAVLARVADRLQLAVLERPADAVAAERFLGVFDALERLASVRPDHDARAWEARALEHAGDGLAGDRAAGERLAGEELAGDRARRVLLDNARRILTVWGRTDDDLLDDYAGRSWGGLAGYYRARWASWVAELPAAIQAYASGNADRLESLDRALQATLRERAEGYLRDGPSPAPADLAGPVVEAARVLEAYRDVLR